MHNHPMPETESTHTHPQSTHPYSQLTPDRVMDALLRLGLWPDGRLLALSSYENRVYRLHLDEPVQGHAAVVVKFYRPGRWSREQILEEHAFAAELAAAEVPVVAPLTLQGQTLHHDGLFDYSVSPVRGGRQPELDDWDTLEWIGRFLGRLHNVGAAQPFVHRPALDLHSFGREPADWLLGAGQGQIPLEVERAWRDAFEEAWTVMQGLWPEAGRDPEETGVRRLRLHGDCHPGNILWTPLEMPGGGPHFVDLDDARMGPAVQDLWMLPSGDRRQRTLQWSALLEGYEQMREFDRRELALVEVLRTLRGVHYSAWLARRWSDPAFPASFPWFGSPDYWRGQVQMLQEQTEAMQAPPLMP